MATEFGISQEGTLIGFINAKNKKKGIGASQVASNTSPR